MIKGILLDFDGVIRHMHIEKTEKVTRQRGFELNELMNLVWDNEPSVELIRGSMDRETWWSKVQNLQPKLKGIPQEFIWDEVFSHPIIDQEVLMIIDELSDTYTTAILSNAEKGSKNKIEKLVGDTKFDHILTSSDFGSVKPEQKVYRETLQVMGIGPEECLFFDDQQNNVEGARKLGMHAYLFERPQQIKQKLEELQS